MRLRLQSYSVDSVVVLWYNMLVRLSEKRNKKITYTIWQKEFDFMIMKPTREVFQTYGVDDNVGLSEIIAQSAEFDSKWKDYLVDNSVSPHYTLTEEQKLVLSSNNCIVTLDLTELALQQICQRFGVPYSYIVKCVESKRPKLAAKNLNSWIKQDKNSLRVRSAEGVARAIVSQNYVPYDNARILQQLKLAMDTKRFVPTQVFLSQDGMQIRFVDFTPLPVSDGTNSPLYAGIVLRSSSVGTGSFSLRFFIYRFACTNGLVIPSMGGTLFRVSHIGNMMRDEKISLFNRAFMDIDLLCDKAVELVKRNNAHRLSEEEMQLMIKKVKNELKLSKEKTDKLSTLITSKYNDTRWGVINGVTELAQEFSLDTRYDIESWAGRFFADAA